MKEQDVFFELQSSLFGALELLKKITTWSQKQELKEVFRDIEEVLKRAKIEGITSNE